MAAGSRTHVRCGAGRAAALTLLALVVFVGIVVAVDTVWQPEATGPGLILVGVVLALVPAALWLALFYVQDRLEPEPKAEVARIFVIGLALAGAMGLPLVQQVFRLPDWQYRDPVATVLGAILVAGVVEAFVIYATVRYFIFHSPQFNERTDGVIYGTAAGLGYATAVNVHFILDSGGATLGAAGVTVAAVALGHAAIGGVFGYFLGRARLEREPIWWLPAGLVVTAVLAGLFTLARRQAEPGRLLVGDAGQLPSVAGLAASAVLALVVAGVVVWLIRRDTALTQRGLRPAPPPDATVGDRAANWAVIGLFLVCLLAGGAVWQAVTNRVTAFAVGEFRGSYPAHFSPATRPDDVLRVTDVMGTQAEFVIASITGEEPLAPRAALPRLAARRAAEYDVYRVLGTQETQWHDRSALMQRFAAVERPAFEPAMPRLIEGADYIIPDGARVVIVTLLATPESYAGVEQLFERFVNDLGF